tara:strand:- start:2315 stop:3424 length:1110 start_codon:yes stop_codon:yes gene_type:complete
MKYLILFSILFFLSSCIYYLTVALLFKFFQKRFSFQFFSKNKVNKKCLIIIPIFNGEKKLRKRIDNIMKFCNPRDYEINLISDGSNDSTLKIAEKISKNQKDAGWNIYVDNNEKNIGRALTHNQTVDKYNHEFILFSDLDTEFTYTFPSKALAYLISNKSCLAVSGKVIFKSNNAYGTFLGRLFLLDVFIRKLSDISKICMKGSGPALIIKKSCWIDLKAYEDIDHCVGFMVLKKGGYLKYKDDSFVYDIANNSSSKDLRARRRMTRKSLLSFFNQLNNLNLKSFRDYLALIGYFIHKPLRFFLIPILFILWIINFYLNLGLIFSSIFLLSLSLFPKSKVINTIVISYILGVYDFLRGRKEGTYKPVNN